MKRSKIVARNSRSQRERSPPRKIHSSGKTTLHHSSQEKSYPSHSSIQRPGSSAKHRTARAKHVHSPSIQSPPSSESHVRHHSRDSAAPQRELSHKKQYEMVKRKSSYSPTNRKLSARDLSVKSLSTAQSGRYRGSRGQESDQEFSSPPKKKMHRMPEKYAPERSSPISRPIHRQPETSHRADPGSSREPVHSTTGDFARSHSNDGYSSSHFYSQGSNHDGYNRSMLQNVKKHDEPGLYMREKRYGSTLDERFSSYSSRGMDSGVHYSYSDLKKITVDIHHSTRSSSPTVRRIINAEEVKLVRRPDEGKKPIFDREEIKWAGPSDKREDAHFEQRHNSSLFASSVSRYEMTSREHENYELTKQKFNTFCETTNPREMRTLSDRWQKCDLKKLEPSYFDRDERITQSYSGRSRHFHSSSDDERPGVSRSRDRDYRDNCSQRSETPYQRDDYPDRRRSLSSNPDDSRYGFSGRSKEEVPCSRDMIINRRDDDPPSRWHFVHRSMSDSNPDRIKDKGSISRGPGAVTSQREYGPEISRRSARGDKLPSYPQKSERFKNQSWPDKPEEPSRSPSYFEPEKRYSPKVNRFNSPGRPVSGRAFRTRPYLGGPRGGMRGRGMSMFRRGSSSRGLGYSGRGMK